MHRYPYIHLHLPIHFLILNSSSPNPPSRTSNSTSTSNSNTTISPTHHPPSTIHPPCPKPPTKNASLLSHHNLPLHLPLLPLLPHHPPNSNFRPSNCPLSHDFRRRDCSSCFTIPTAAGGTAYARNGDGDADGNDK